MIQNTSARHTTSLAGKWRAVVDPYEAGYRSPWGEPWKLGWFRHLPVTPGLAEVDFDRADRLDVPGDWNSQDPRLLLYEGTLWYQRRFRLPAAGSDTRRFVQIGAANYHARVYLNGELLGEHEGGFTPFAFEITDALHGADRDEDEILTVQVDNTRRREAVPTLSTDWWNYGGLTRDVLVVDVPETFLREYFVYLDPEDPGRIRGFLQLDGPRPAQRVTVRIPELGVEFVGGSDPSGRAEIDLPLPDGGLDRWSPARPKRYDVVLKCETDRVVEAVGFRTVETRGHEILLNGEPLFLRGISLHEEAPGRPGRAFGEDDARTLLGWARDLGCNFVRLAHYPHDEATVRVAEEMGLLVWAEIPVYWRIAWEEPATLECARRQLGELVTRDHNRAAVVLWSLANEAPPTDERLAFLGSLVERARSLDPTRLLTAALMARMEPDADPDAPGCMVLDDPLGAHLDVLACNQYLGWYYGAIDRVPDVRWRTPWDKPLIMSEFGGSALAGHHGPADEPFTEENQAAIYEAQIAMLRQVPFLAGLSPWILKDFRSPRRVLRGIQDGFNRKGLVSERGQRKLAFEVLRRWYAELAGEGA